MNQLLDKCIKETKYIHEGEIFTVKDLFKGYEWNRLSLGERRNISFLFRNYIYINSCLNIINVDEVANKKKEKVKFKKVNVHQQKNYLKDYL